MKNGRPTLYKKEYDDEIIRFVREHEDDAVFIEEMADHFDVCVDTLYDWSYAYPSFLEAFTRARDLAASKFRKVGVKNMVLDKSQNFSAQAFMFVGENLDRAANNRRRKYKKLLSQGTQAEKAAKIIEQVEDARIEVDQAHSLMKLVKDESEIIDKCDIAKRLEALEQKLK